jgi:hypothetical protein
MNGVLKGHARQGDLAAGGRLGAGNAARVPTDLPVPVDMRQAVSDEHGLSEQRQTQRHGVYHFCPLVLDDPLPDDPAGEPLLEGLLLDEPVPGELPVDELLLDDPPLPDELPEGDSLDDDLSGDDFSEELFPDGDAPIPELLSIPDEDPLPLPEESTPSALAVLSSSRPVADKPFCF